MLKQRAKHSYQWLHSTIYHHSRISQSSPDSLRIQDPSNLALASCIQSLLSKNTIERVKCKSPTVQASDRPNQAQHLSTRRKVQNGNGEWVSLLDLSDANIVFHQAQEST